ncbi:HD-GYP domain-containing protein [Oryzihumus sp.]|uniref:HD-GYP domain-containing protein n=1 Tax=Oryzihumus sp. TaxID=1968903 RepID=UPI002EDB26BA
MRARALDVERVLALAGAALVLVAVGQSVHEWGPGGIPSPVVVGAFVVAIAAGELLRIGLPGSRESAPIASAAAFAFAITTEAPRGEPAEFAAGLVVAATALAMALGVAPHLVRGQVVRLPDLTTRLFSVAVAAVLFREVPLWEGQTLVQVALDSTVPRWLVAVAMLLVTLVALLVEAVLAAVVRATRDHARFPRVLSDELRAASGLATALATTGALIALAERPLGVAAIPLFLFPLVLTQFAVRRYASVRATYRQTIRSLSRLTELAGYTEPGHALRVATVSLAMGRDLGMSERDSVDLEYAALLHDIGQVALREPIPGGATVMAAPADQRRIADDGAEIVRQTGVLDNVARIMEAQTTPFRQVREFGEDLPLASRIIKVVNAFDDLVGDSPSRARREAAVERIHLGLGYEYDPRVVDSLTRVLGRGVL